MTIRELLAKSPNGLSINEIMVKTGKKHREIKDTLAKLPIEFDGEYYYLYESPQQKEQIMQKINKTQTAVTWDNQITPAKKPKNKPFTSNPMMGYQVLGGKVKIFLDRRASSKTLTLSVENLKELVNAIEKVQE